jgi:cytoskeletal protein CcmA (bactofilin family)
VSGPGDLRVEGSLEGSIRVRGRVVVAGGGTVRREVSAREIEVAGRAEGFLQAADLIRVRKGGLLQGEAVASRWVVEDGAALDLHMKLRGRTPSA